MLRQGAPFPSGATHSRAHRPFSSCALAARSIRIPPDVANEVLVSVWNVPAQQLQPLGPGHHLEVPLQARVHLRAVDDRAGLRVVAHLLQRPGRTEHVARELLPLSTKNPAPRGESRLEQRLGDRRQFDKTPAAHRVPRPGWPAQQGSHDAAKLIEPGAPPREHRAQQPRHREHVLAVRDRREDVLFYPLTVEKYSLLVTARTEVPS
jgi:hypothetical protein